MYAVIRAGGKQYRVAPGDIVRVEKIITGTDGLVEFPVLAVSSEAGQLATKSDARVVGQAMEEGRGAKILVFHYKRKKQYKKTIGHRQSYTEVKVGGIGDEAVAHHETPVSHEAPADEAPSGEVEA